MSQKVTIGGQRLGAGKRMTAEMHGYERSTHDLSYLWRTTAAAGTLIPFMTELALPGDTFDIDLDAIVMTHPTVGPLFGSFKVQCDVFVTPIRLYQGQLHNDKLGIGRDMAAVKLPLMRLRAASIDLTKDPDNQHVNPSCILSYLGIRGLGNSGAQTTERVRDFNAVPFMAYWDIYKNYYANKQEEIGAGIHTPAVAVIQTITTVGGSWGSETLPQAPTKGNIKPSRSTQINFNFSGATPKQDQIILVTNMGEMRAKTVFATWTVVGSVLQGTGITQNTSDEGIVFYSWRYQTATDIQDVEPTVATFPLKNIDDMREAILSSVTTPTAFLIGGSSPAPYVWPIEAASGSYSKLASQEGLGLKTYQSDLFNNWISTEWISGSTGVNAISAVSTAGGSFTIDTLNLAQKIYNMLNRIAISGGSYDDYLEATYDHAQYRRATSPIYMGGLSKELVFQEVVSNAAATEVTTEQPLGTLAGKGVMSKKKKGGKVVVKVDEPSYIMGIFSLTPRIDYSQGNGWDVNLKTMADFHRPALDQIGFQDLITDQMAWWDSVASTTGAATFKSAGKQPAWINYMTNVNKVLGNFAIRDNEMFMTLNRRYEFNSTSKAIKDLTTYIDPVKFNHIFAQTSRDAQNFWVQMSVDITARRKMSAKIMPNL